MHVAVGQRVCTAYVTLKESVRKSTKVVFAWDFGLANVRVTNLLMLTQAGTPCPESTWKKYLPHRLNNSRSRRVIEKLDRLFVGLWNKCNRIILEIRSKRL